MPVRRPLILALLALLAWTGTAVGARILPPGGRYGDAAVDLSTNGRAAVAYERSLPGPDLVRVAIRRADRLNRPTVGRDIGRGNLRLVRVGGVASGPHLMAWKRRGELLASVLTRGAWRTERLPAEVRTFDALTAAIAGSRVVLVAGDDDDAVAVVRVGPRRWVTRPLPAGPPRARMVVRASEPSGRVVAVWSESGVTGPSAEASAFDPGALAWTPPATLSAGTIPSPVPFDLSLNGRGDAIVSLVADAPFPGTQPGVAEARFLPAVSGTWTALPDVPVAPPNGAPKVAVTPSGTPLYARLEDDVRVAFLTGGAWSAEEHVWSGPDPATDARLSGVGDLAVAQGGRVVAAVAVDPGPAPDDHVFLVRSPTTGAWSAPTMFGSSYGGTELIVGGRRVAASWVEDLNRLPEAVLAP
jgi:hypothetical protein